MSSGFGESAKSASASSENSSNIDVGDFNCSICIDLVQEPVATLCGHLFCWRCLYRWLHHRSRSKGCPVCKAVVEEQKLVPLYGKGKSVTDDPRMKSYLGMVIPPRPSGQRPPTVEDDDDDDEDEDDEDEDEDDDEDEEEFVVEEEAEPIEEEEEELVEEEEEEVEDPDYVAAPDIPTLHARLESNEQRFKEYRESTEQRFNEYNEFINEFKEFRDEYREFRAALQPRLEQIEQRIKDINECRVDAEQRIKECRAEAELRIELSRAEAEERIKECRAEAEERIKECRAEYDADTD